MRMKITTLAALMSIALSACGESQPAPPGWTDVPADGSLLGIFEGRFPCDGCERLKVGLALYRDPTTLGPTTYAMREIRVGHDEPPSDSGGTWRTSVGTYADPNATVYELIPTTSDVLVLYQKADDNILLLLDAEKRLKVGNASHSFTLSRTR